jgi:O-antigen/teichoic acid export membrane protein
VKNSYQYKYLQIYLWQGASFILSFLSMFIVVPFLTSVQEVYGIYTVCVSITIFLSYADLGFIGAGQKYAAEYFARNDRENESRVIGFSHFILAVFLLLFLGGFLFLSYRPESLINDLKEDANREVASSLFLILATFTPVTLLQRLAQMIFGIRLEDYFIQRANIFASLLKISSVLFFLNNGRYDIVGYFLFSQMVNLVTSVVVLLIARKRYHYDFIKLFRSIRFSREMYRKTKGLAFTSLYLTLTWILYYELDSIVISKVLGAEQVAIYAVGLTIMSFFRTIYAVIFAPFGARFNHFIGLNDEAGLRAIHMNVATLFAPVVIIPVLTVCLMARPLILSWVGADYAESVGVAQFLILCFIYGFITYPGSLLLMAKERTRELYLIGTITPVVYWFGIALTYPLLGLKAFGLFKFVAFTLSGGATLYIMLRFLKLPMARFWDQVVRPNLFPVLFLVAASLAVSGYLPEGKSKLHLLTAALTTGAIIMASFGLFYLTSPEFKAQFNKMILKRSA